MQNKKKLVRLICKVTPMTLWNLRRLAKISGCGDNFGKVIDKLVREKMISLKITQSDTLVETAKIRKDCKFLEKEYCVVNRVKLIDDSMCKNCNMFCER